MIYNLLSGKESLVEYNTNKKSFFKPVLSGQIDINKYIFFNINLYLVYNCKGKDHTVIINGKHIKKRLKEYFRALLNEEFLGKN